MREKDEAWEALVCATHANPAVERGQLNQALKAIREAARMEGLEEESLAAEIRLRADAYRETFNGCALTPMALAKHWFRVVAPQVSATSQTLARLRAVS